MGGIFDTEDNFEAFDRRLQQQREAKTGRLNDLATDGRKWLGGGVRSIDNLKWRRRNLALRNYLDMENNSWAPEIENFTNDDSLNYLWDELDKDDQRSLLEEQSFKKEVTDRLRRIKKK